MQYFKLSIAFTVFLISSILFAEDGHHAKNVAIRFPAKLGDMTYKGVIKYAKPGGFSVRYQDASQFRIDIYIYDGNKPNIGSGIDSKVLKNEFASVLLVFPYMEKLGHYKDVKIVDKGQKKVGETAFLWAQYSFEQINKGGGNYLGKKISDTYIVGRKNYFIKLRMTMKKEDAAKKKKVKDKFLKDLGYLLLEGN
ncbi:MAG: hypothetical protein HRT89_16480 [Lentisphaeria bacterium]|nr:hypothetical protein [Lentisphaeria bacterium]NQZ69656.1 hypothetical protein [Lentisphaeria bacterium]